MLSPNQRRPFAGFDRATATSEHMQCRNKEGTNIFGNIKRVSTVKLYAEQKLQNSKSIALMINGIDNLAESW